jgi:hypothetical protein
MLDTRILGQWRSDAARTVRELKARADIPAASKRGLSRLFGRLELRFTKTRCYSTLNGHIETALYRVVAKDGSSLAIVSQGKITHIHFEGTRFWILVGTGKFREYFRRVK